MSRVALPIGITLGAAAMVWLVITHPLAFAALVALGVALGWIAKLLTEVS